MHEIIVFDSIYLTLLAMNGIPFLIAFVTNEVTRKGVKEGLLFILTGAATWVDEAIAENGQVVFDDFLLTWTGLFLGSAGFYFGWQRKTITPPVERSGLSVGAPPEQPPQ